MNVKTKLRKALQDAMTEVQVYDYELVNKRYLKPDEAQWRVEALIRAEGKVELICELLGIPNPFKRDHCSLAAGDATQSDHGRGPSVLMDAPEARERKEIGALLSQGRASSAPARSLE